MRKKIIIGVIAAAFIAAGLAAPLASAQAAPLPSPAAASACKVGLWNGSSYGPPWGYQICGTTEQNFAFPHTTHESFVIGTNHAVWTTWTGQTAWHSLGGQACGSSDCGVYLLDEAPTIGVVGPQGTTGWCDSREANGTWTGWVTGCLFP
jgi:hypothetical protein